MLRAMAPPPAGLVAAGEEAAPATTARLRLARELHDSVASAIVVIGVQAGGADQALDRGEAGRERAREVLRTIRTASRQVLEDLQATVATLRGGSGADGPVRGVGQLDALTSLAADAGVRVDLTVQGVARRLPPAVDLAAYRIVHEALTNLLRHAGPATAMVRLSYDEDHLAVQVDDDGHGATAGWPPVGGNGLLGMRERIAALGGPAAPADRAAARGPPGQDRAGRRGEQHTQIAVRLGVAVNTVSQWRKRFSQAGLPPRE
jgi:signal transduction histidine kinase